MLNPESPMFTTSSMERMMRFPYYDRDGNPIDLFRWAELFEDMRYRMIGDNTYRNIRVSTVWIGIDHGWGSTVPIIFETMVFRSGHGHEMWRYSTEEEAIVGHRAVVAELLPLREAGTWAKPLEGVFAVACPLCWTIPEGKYRPKGRGPRTIRICPDCAVRWRQGFRAPRPVRQAAWA